MVNEHKLPEIPSAVHPKLATIRNLNYNMSHSSKNVKVEQGKTLFEDIYALSCISVFFIRIRSLVVIAANSESILTAFPVIEPDVAEVRIKKVYSHWT
jgi:hypothetical protein